MNDDVKNVSLNFNAKIQPVKKLNDQFTYCKCYAHAIGKNRNLSHFSKENVLRNSDSINYIPVIGHLIEREDGTLYMGSHDIEFLINEDGLQIKQLTVPFGVVVDNTLAFEDVTESNGSVVTYVTVDVILWTGRYPELLTAIYSEDIYFNESMEINYTKWKALDEDKNYTDIIDWVYSALCLLGKSDNPNEHSEPCFPSSRIEPYANNFNQSEFSKVMGELKDQLSFYFNKENQKEGGTINLNDEIKSTILKEFNLALEDIDFEITDDMSEEDFRLKLEEFTNNKKDDGEGQKYEPVLFSATYQQKFEAIQNALEGSVVKDTEGNITEETRYWVEDFDDTYAYVAKSVWSPEDYNRTYGRFTYTFDDVNAVASISGEFEEMVVGVWLTKEENQKLQEERATFELLKTEFDNYKEQYSIPNTEVDELKEFKRIKLECERNEAETELFEKFDEELSSIEEYTKLKEKAKEFSIEQLEEKMFVILGKKNANFSIKSKNNNIIKIPVGKEDDEIEDPYGGILAKKYK